MDIHPFESVSECIKCGQRKWPAPCQFEIRFLSDQWVTEGTIEGTNCRKTDKCDVLELTCKNCGYRWLEHTKDYVEPKLIELNFAPQGIKVNPLSKPKELTIEEQANKEVSEICTVLMVDEKPVLVRPRKWYEFL